jgi:endonuclease/exonuclease/phosphatase family metal-dependent hydrolase
VRARPERYRKDDLLTATRPDPTALRVATFNIRHASRTTQRGSRRRLRTAVQMLDVDILGLQEVDRFHARSGFADQVKVARRASRADGSAFALARWHWGGRYGNALVVRGRIVDHETVPLPRPAKTERRVALVALVDVLGVSASVVVAHLHNDDAPTAHRQLDFALEQLTALPRPWVFLADVNLDRDRFEPVVRAAGFDLPPVTLTTPWQTPRRQIDCVAVAGLDIVGAQAPLTVTSDHRPIVVDLTTRPGLAEFPSE